LAAPATQPAGAQQSAVCGHFSFTPPAGWLIHQTASGFSLTPPGSKPDGPAAAVIAAFPPVSLDGAAPADWFKSFIADAHKGMQELKRGDMKSQPGVAKTTVISQVFVLQQESLIQYRMYVAIATASDVQVLTYSSASGETFNKLQPSFAQFIRSMRPVTNSNGGSGPASRPDAPDEH
jgi:hypothetical protein